MSDKEDEEQVEKVREESEEGEESAEKEADKDGDNDDDDAEAINQKDVFGEDSDDEAPTTSKDSKLRSRLTQRGSDDSGDSAEEKEETSEKEDSDDDDDEASRKEKKKKKKKERKGKKEKEKEKKKRRSRGEEEDVSPRKRRRGEREGSAEGSDAEAVKEKRVFEDSEDEDEDNDAGIDTETGEKVSGKNGGSGKKLSKREQKELRERELTKIESFILKLKKAALDDRNALKEKRMGTSKMLLLEELRVELERQRTQQDYLERGVLKSLKLWLDPQDTEAKTFKARAGSLANRKLLENVLSLILNLPMEHVKKSSQKGVETTFHDNMDLVEQSEIGKSVRFVQNALENEKTTEAYKLACKVRQKWSRIIYKKSASYAKSADQMDEDDDAGPTNLPKANRAWEKMPENVNSKGERAVKGDFGFRFGASVPRMMLVDFVKQPESKIVINGREVDIEEALDRAKDDKNEVRARLGKIGVETIRGNNEGKNMRAKAPELNRLIVGGVASKVSSFGWTERVEKHSLTKSKAAAAAAAASNK